MNPGKTILLVEDDGCTHDALTHFLESDGFRVLGARDGASALALLRGPTRPDLIILDLMLPGLSGWELREHQRRDQALACIPVIVLSALARSAGDSTDLGGATYLTKPVEPRELLPIVQKVLAAPSLGRRQDTSLMHKRSPSLARQAGVLSP